MHRRSLLQAAAAAASAAFVPGLAQAALPGARRLSFENLHTGDRFADCYFEQGAYRPDALAEIAHVLRDHRSGESHLIDPKLLDLLVRLSGSVETRAPFQVISGYRSPKTNAMLTANSSGVAKRSLHMEGRAIDVRVAGVELTRLRDAAIALGGGGVGYYAASDFVHVDTGRVRRW